jgi:hypothetical protein
MGVHAVGTNENGTTRWESDTFPTEADAYRDRLSVRNDDGWGDDGSAAIAIRDERRAFLDDPEYRFGTDAKRPLTRQEAADTQATHLPIEDEKES